MGYDFGDHAYDIDKFDGLDIVLCGDIHLRQTIYTESVIEIEEELFEEYSKKGWKKIKN